MFYKIGIVGHIAIFAIKTNHHNFFYNVLTFLTNMLSFAIKKWLSKFNLLSQLNVADGKNKKNVTMLEVLCLVIFLSFIIF